jgi:hypothetical protein
MDPKNRVITSVDSLAEASRSRAQFSGHGRSLGSAGFREASNHPKNCAFLNEPGSAIAVTPPAGGFRTAIRETGEAPFFPAYSIVVTCSRVEG